MASDAPPVEAPLVEARGLGVHAGRAVLLDGVDLTVARGEWVALIGPNGAGKSTLINALCGLKRYQGSLRIDQIEVAELSYRERARRLALVPQEPELPPWLTVGEYVLLGRTAHVGAFGRESAADGEIAAEALGQLDLADLAERRLDTLSGGERQRAVVARALAQRSAIVVLDEPTAALDVGHQQQAFELLAGLRESQGLTLLCAMHDLTLAARYADRLVLLDRGRVVAGGTPSEVLTEDRIASVFGARVQVLELAEGLAVLPASRSTRRAAIYDR